MARASLQSVFQYYRQMEHLGHHGYQWVPILVEPLSSAPKGVQRYRYFQAIATLDSCCSYQNGDSMAVRAMARDYLGHMFPMSSCLHHRLACAVADAAAHLGAAWIHASKVLNRGINAGTRLLSVDRLFCLLLDVCGLDGDEDDEVDFSRCCVTGCSGFTPALIWCASLSNAASLAFLGRRSVRAALPDWCLCDATATN